MFTYNKNLLGYKKFRNNEHKKEWKSETRFYLVTSYATIYFARLHVIPSYGLGGIRFSKQLELAQWYI